MPWDSRYLISKVGGRGRRSLYHVLNAEDRAIVAGPLGWTKCRNWIEDQRETGR